MVDICVCETAIKCQLNLGSPFTPKKIKGNGQRESNLNAEGRWVTGTSGALAYLTPMHILGPLLKGRKAMSINLFSAGSVVSHREGLKVSGEE